jgi:hypothetical protein
VTIQLLQISECSGVFFARRRSPSAAANRQNAP